MKYSNLKFNLTEPEEELLSGYEFIHFVAYCKEDSEDIIMCRLRSPYQLNGELFHMIYQNSMLPLADNEADDTLHFLTELPVFCDDVLVFYRSPDNYYLEVSMVFILEIDTFPVLTY
jgi:hypothetical protein